MKSFISIGYWIATVILTIVLFFVVFLISLFLFPFDKKKKLAHAQCFWWADCTIVLNPFWRLRLEGLENIDRKKTYVVIANHQSIADIVVLYKSHMQFKWISKESLFRIPFIGWCLFLTRHIKLNRGDYSSIKKVYRQAADWLRQDVSVLFFPEGTRSDNDNMNFFQNGAFKLAIKEKKPILPIRIIGTRDAIPKGSWLFKTKVKATLTVLPAIETSNFHPADFSILKDIVRKNLESVTRQ